MPIVGLSATKLATPIGLPIEEGGTHPAGQRIRPVKGRMSSVKSQRPSERDSVSIKTPCV